jgi:antitoxin CptB
MSSERSRLVWRCRRGTKELDLILGRFLDHGYDRLDAAERQTFERLLDCEDDLLQDWFLTDAEPADAELAALVDIIRHSH